MFQKKNLSIALLVIGAGLFLSGVFVASKAHQEEGRVAQAEESGEGHHRPILGPVRREARNGAATSYQGQIREGAQRAAAAQVRANWLRGIGAVLFIGGLGSLLIARKRNG